jgi:hypothetical protein
MTAARLTFLLYVIGSVCRKLKKYEKVCKSMTAPEKMCKSMIASEKVCQKVRNVSKCEGVCQNIGKCAKILKNVSKPEKVCQNFRKFVEMPRWSGSVKVSLSTACCCQKTRKNNKAKSTKQLSHLNCAISQNKSISVQNHIIGPLRKAFLEEKN